MAPFLLPSMLEVCKLSIELNLNLVHRALINIMVLNVFESCGTAICVTTNVSIQPDTLLTLQELLKN